MNQSEIIDHIEELGRRSATINYNRQGPTSMKPGAEIKGISIINQEFKKKGWNLCECDSFEEAVAVVKHFSNKPVYPDKFNVDQEKPIFIAFLF